MYAKSSDNIGVAKSLKPITKDQVGVSWYPKQDASPAFDQGKKIIVKPGLDTLSKALQTASDSDVLVLEAGEYSLSRVLPVNKAITVRAAKITKQPSVLISYERGALFEIQHGGSLKLQGLKITGAESPDSSGNTVIRTVRHSMLTNYDLIVENCEVVDLDINHSFSFVDVGKGTFADRIEIRNSVFNNITGSILGLNKETDDYGIYNAEYVTVKDSTFNGVKGSIVDFYRGGTDESTFGPHFNMQGSTIDNVGKDKRNKSKTSVRLHGVQVTSMSGNTLINTPAIKINHTVGEPVTKIIKNQFTATPVVKELNSDKENTAHIADNVIKAN